MLISFDDYRFPSTISVLTLLIEYVHLHCCPHHSHPGVFIAADAFYLRYLFLIFSVFPKACASTYPASSEFSWSPFNIHKPNYLFIKHSLYR